MNTDLVDEALANRACSEQEIPGWRRIQREVLERRYLRKDERGNVVETPEQMFSRVARAVAKVEAEYGTSNADMDSFADRCCDLMRTGTFLPNSPTLMNAGLYRGTLAACFVLPVEDSVEAIFDTVKSAALIQKVGGGTGFPFDELRPTGDRVASSGGTTSGPVSFWRVFAEATRAIQQGAHRRGANMGMLSLEHPDILKFIAAKRDPARFRISTCRSRSVTRSWRLSQPIRTTGMSW